MKQNHYECVVIINAALEDEQINSSINRIEVSIKTNGGEIEDVDQWGRKRLAYPINKSKSGFYVIFRYFSPSDAVAKIERDLRLDETIIRYLTVLLDSDALDHFAQLKNKAEKTEELENKPAVKAEESETKEKND
ncbi:MAG: 30S ribosomal protein S6 [Bacteroidetes bacterium]|nr:30S ribosomal protein S6 [Bacteroidota bacterium]